MCLSAELNLVPSEEGGCRTLSLPGDNCGIQSVQSGLCHVGEGSPHVAWCICSELNGQLVLLCSVVMTHPEPH